MDLIEKVIEVTEVVAKADAIKLKDEKNLTYTLNKKKKGGEPTVAFLTYQKIGDLSGTTINIKYEESPWEYQGKPVVSRYIKMLELANPLEKSVSEIKQEIKTTETEKTDWDSINAKKTADIHKGMSYNKCMDYFIKKGTDLEKPEGIKRLQDLISMSISVLEE